MYNLDNMKESVEKGVPIAKPVSTSDGDLTGVPLKDVKQRPCSMLRWADNNNSQGLKFKTFFILTSDGGTQGVSAYKNGSRVGHIETFMGGGDASDPRKQIYINNAKIIKHLVLSLPNIDITQLEADIQADISEGRHNPIGSQSGNLAGVSLRDAGIMRSPCGALKWCGQNNADDLSFKTFGELGAEGGEQGVLVYDEGVLVKTYKVPMGGGLDGDPMYDVYRTNNRLIMKIIQFIEENK